MNIRFAKETDVNQIIVLCEAHAIFEKSDYNPNHKAELLSDELFRNSNGLQCLVVEQNNILIGYATFMKQFSTWDANYYIYLDCLFLSENARGNGIGFQMMCKIKEYAISQKCKLIQWQTPAFNENAILFYNKIGAKSNTKERFFWTVN